MNTWLILGAVVVAGTLWFWRQATKRTVTTVAVEKNPYYATSIHFPESACESVKSMAARRFLVGEAPAIPLPKCGAGNCECTYKHYQDRRSGSRDRRAPTGLSVGGGAWGNRGSHGRRKSDWRIATSAGDSRTVS